MNKKYSWIVYLTLLLQGACVESGASSNNGTTDTQTTQTTTQTPVPTTAGYGYLNTLRQRAGLQSFKFDQQLQQAAQNHADYLNVNNVSGHGESSGLAGFTGANATDRAVAAGYKSRLVGENVSGHSPDVTYQNSIDGLMSAIYHRYGFLSQSFDLVGMGNQKGGGRVDAYVYNMGNSVLNGLCAGSSFTGVGSYVNGVCADSSFQIETSQYQNSQTTIAQSNPAIVKWPAANSVDTPPGFYEESPDPLPAYSVSGYPVSVEFNAQHFSTAPTVSSFTLTKVSDSSVVNAAVVMNKSNDPNSKHTDYQHTFFPDQHLEWNTEYEASLNYNDGSNKTLKWRYTTRNPQVSLFRITQTGQTINSVSSGEQFALYIPPVSSTDSNSLSTLSTLGSITVDVQPLDANTLLIKATGSGEVNIDFHSLKTKVILP